LVEYLAGIRPHIYTLMLVVVVACRGMKLKEALPLQHQTEFESRDSYHVILCPFAHSADRSLQERKENKLANVPQ
jgi:hypothetical protein